MIDSQASDQVRISKWGKIIVSCPEQWERLVGSAAVTTTLDQLEESDSDDELDNSTDEDE